jgi:hypothetical protein
MATFNEDVIVNGTITANNIVIPLNSVGDAQFKTDDPLTAEKQIHQHLARFAIASATTAADTQEPIHQGFGAGVIYAAYASVVDPCVGAATIDIDILKNGVSILSTDFKITNSHDAYEKIDAGIADPVSYSVDDFFEVVIDVTAGGGTIGKGLIVTLVLRENPE